jgi:hypothetical protein
MAAHFFNEVFVAFLLFRLLELLFPQVVHQCGICVREDDAEDVAVPVDWVALDVFFDVL